MVGKIEWSQRSHLMESTLYTSTQRSLKRSVILVLLSINLMDSSFTLLRICAAAIGFFTILGTLLFFVLKKSRSDTQNKPTASSSSSSSSPVSSPPSSSSPNWIHQVFVSFTGKDVGGSFLSRILNEFSREGIEPFIDNGIHKSNSIDADLREAIRGSRIAIVMLSMNYASSLWCLSELVEIIKCKRELSQQVVPIFYKLDPIDVRRQTGDFGEVFKKTCVGKTKEDIGRWSQALEKVATIAGCNSRNWDNEEDMLENIASDISNILNNSTPSSDFEVSDGLLRHAVYIYCADALQYSFASHLSVDFRRKRIAAFVNRTVDVMDGATASVVVFSKNYLSSASCLDKLVRVLQCRRKTGQLVVPVFYGISPSDVVVQEHGSASRIREWSSALQELRELPSHQSREESSECQVVEEIVKDVCEKLFPTEQIGINSRLLEIEQLLCKQPWGIRRIGIWGMPGIGKTTLAKAVFDQISGGYEASCFIKHFDKAFHEKGLHRLLEEHFGEILKELPRVCSSITRPSLPGDKLCKKRALVVLDDVHNHLVAESFLGGFHWFGPGSLIIITSRDKQVFRLCQINHVYEVQSLNEDEALQLFSQYAFAEDIREENLLELSKEVIDYTNGNPLALSFYGGELKGKKLSEMETTFLKLKLRTPYKIHYLFKSSYETLNDNEKNIFLDIACFFKGEDVDYVMQLLEGCGFFPHVGIDVLVEKCLVTISENRVEMHRLIQDFGREIINGETAQIERRRRLWEPWTIKFLLEDDKLEANGYPKATCKRVLGTEDTEGIFLDTSNFLFDVKPTAFDNMLNLRFLKIYCSNHENQYGLRLPRGLESLPYELRLLHWESYPLQSLPQDFDPCHLVELNMSHSQLQKLWGGTKNLEKLKTFKLCHCQQLTEIEDLCRAPNTELIDLQGCTKLQRFPATGQLQHLRVVNLSGCTEITSLPEVSPNIEELHLQGTGIRELPISIVTLAQQDNLNRELSNLLTEFSGVANALNLKKLKGLAQVVSSNQHLDKLVILNMKDCYHLQSLPHMVDLESLKVLDLSGCSELKSIQGFPRNLKELYLVGTAVEELPPLPSSIELLNAHGCVSLISIPFGFERLPRYYTFSNCIALSAQVVGEFVKNALTNVERIAREYHPELNKSLAFSFAVPSPASKKFTCDLQPGSSVMIQLGSSWRSTLGFAILVELSFLEDFHEASGFSISCVCRWKDKEFISHSLEKIFHCWTPGEGVPKDHMFVFGDLNMHPSICEGNDLSILADLVVFEFFTVDKQEKLLDESYTVTKCGVHVITAANGDASSSMTQPFSSPDDWRANVAEEVLRVSYDGLEENDKNLFLFIACLFSDKKSAFLAPLRASIGLGISSRLELLANKFLIHRTPYGIIVRHGLLQKLASTNHHSNRAEFSSSTATTTATSSSSVERQSEFSEAASESSGGTMSNSGLLLESPNLKVYSFLDLKRATKNFNPDSMLGEGLSGKLYKGLSSGMTVAVKRLNTEGVQGLAEWRSEVNFKGKYAHPNLVKLLGYCCEDREFLLVYEFMPKGSFENHLFRRNEPFPWDLRMKIVIGAAHGLAYLHSLPRQVIYRDFKSSDILLDSNYDAKLSEFGVAKLGPSNEKSHVTTRIMGTLGYAAPEYMATGRLTVKSDVYGFGVVLLEVMTGLRAHNPKRPYGQENLVDWLRPDLSSKHKVKRLMDKGIEGQYTTKVATEMARITLSCVEPDPKYRPHMQEVLDVLEQIQRINVVPGRSSTKKWF